MFEFAFAIVFFAWPLPLLLWWWRNDEPQSDRVWVPFAQRWRDAQRGITPFRERTWRKWWQPLLLWTLFVFAAAQPQWVGDPIANQRSGRDVMLVVDLSGSMEATDLVLNNEPATRLDVLKKVLGEFILQREGDRLGLVLFGEQAYLQAPLTFDRKTVNQFLQESEIGLAGARRTAIGDGLAMGLKHLQESEAPRRAVVLITDGANNGGELTPDQATDMAKKLNTIVYTIGVGADEMIVRDAFFGSRRVNPSADLDERALKRIAEQTGGQYFRARDENELATIYKKIDQLEPVKSDNQWLRPTKPLYWYPLLAALVAWAIGVLWQKRRTWQMAS